MGVRVGYLGRLKRELEIELKDPEAWKREGGLPHTKEQTDSDLAVVEMWKMQRGT